MPYFLGEFECRLDAKGRMMIPVNLKKQLPEAEREGLVINRGFEKHLVIYPRKQWDLMVEDLAKLNQFDEKNREFVMYFLRGAMDVYPDATGRILIPKKLLDYAGIGTDAVLAGNLSKIDLWAQNIYDEKFDMKPENFAKLAQDVMGSLKKPNE